MQHIDISRRAASRALRCISLLMSLGTLIGCQSIHSEAVVDLIDIEHKKVVEAKKNAATFDKQTNDRINAFESAVSALDTALQLNKKEEAKHALIFSSNRNLSNKKGVDAHAVAYLIARIYISRQIGLEQQVKNQFKADFAAMRKLSTDINASWRSIEDLQAKVLAFSKKSAFASIDSEFITAVVQETNIDTSALDNVIKTSKQVNGALKQSLGITGGSKEGGQTRQALDDLIELLETVK